MPSADGNGSGGTRRPSRRTLLGIPPYTLPAGHARISKDTTGAMMTRQADTHILPPLTPEERDRTLAVLERLRNLRAELLAVRGGKLFPSSGRDLDELRAEREGELA